MNDQPPLFHMPESETPGQMRRSASLSMDGRMRWTLTRDWNDALPKVCWIGLNPSTADHRKDDPTVRAWTHFSAAWGYGGFCAVNLYPIRTPEPAAARWWAREDSDEVRDALAFNASVLRTETQHAALIVACWGDGAHDSRHVAAVIDVITKGHQRNKAIHCLGLTLASNPKHPMARGKHRIPRRQAPMLWRSFL